MIKRIFCNVSSFLAVLADLHTLKPCLAFLVLPEVVPYKRKVSSNASMVALWLLYG